MNPRRRYLEDRKGINTILAALLMVVIVVVAAVMVYAWSTGLLGTLLVNPNSNKEGPLNPVSYAFSNPTNVTIYTSNSGSSNVTLASYFVTDSSGNTYQLLGWSPQPTITPTASKAINILVGSSCPSCQYTGATGAFSQFNSGYSYTVKVLTTKNNPFTFTITK